MTYEMSNSELKIILGHETYIEYLEWKLCQGDIDIDDLDHRIRLYKKINSDLELKSLLLGSFYKPRDNHSVNLKRKSARLKQINDFYKSYFASTPTPFYVLNEMFLNWLGGRGDRLETVLKIIIESFDFSELPENYENWVPKFTLDMDYKSLIDNLDQ